MSPEVGDSDVIRDLQVTLMRVETKLDASLTRVDDHEARIRRLERAVWIAAGVAAASGGTVGAAAASFLQSAG